MSMFNFLFDGSIGEMGERLVNYAAPVQTQTQQYQLAIQHHRNDEARHFIQSGQTQVGNTADCGLADIHVACRFNNRLILELLISQGLDINLLDKAHNTPLHYASKFGNIDICRYLVALNARTGCRNTSGQSPYDVAESHSVRQFLLPLQFQEEANHPDAIAQQQQSQDPFAIGGRSQVPTNVAPPPVFSPPHGGGDLSANSPQVNYYGQQQQQGGYQNRYVAYPGMEASSSTQQSNSSVPNQQYMNHPPTPAQPPAMTSYIPPQGSKSAGHIIQPDGFGSSQTDVKLQQKYGNVKEQVYISPPPMGVLVQSSSAPPQMNRSSSNSNVSSSASLPLPSSSLPAPTSLPTPDNSSRGRGRNSAPNSSSGISCPPPAAVGLTTTPSPPLPTPSTATTTAPVTTQPPLPPAPLSSTSKTPSTFASSTTVIKPDGFGSSQTDVKLQQKYGNVKEQVYISPPPMGGGGSPRSLQTGGPPPPQQQQQQSAVSYGAPPAMYQQAPPSFQQQQQQQQVTPPLPYAHRASATSSVPKDDPSATFSTIDLNSSSSSSSSRSGSHSSGDYVVQATSTSSAMM